MSTPGGLPWVSTFAPISPMAVSKSMRSRSSTFRWIDSPRSSMAWWGTSSPWSSRVGLACNSKGSWERRRLEASEGFLDCRVVGEYSVEGGELEHDTNLLVGRREPELALAASHLLQCCNHRAKACAVDEADTFHVDDDLLRAVLYDFGDRFL